MATKNTGTAPRKRRAPSDRDTASYEQLMGTPQHGRGDRRQTRMPHERDESARGTGNRMDEPAPAPSSKQITRGAKDVHEGQVDTDRRGVPDDIPTTARHRKR